MYIYIYIYIFPTQSLLYGVLAEQRVCKCMSAVLALDVRKDNEFRVSFINMDAFDPP